MKKRLPLAERLKKGLQQAIAAEKGELELRTHTVEIPDPPRAYTAQDVQRVRLQLGHSQSSFARVLAVSLNTVQSWEQGVRTPSRTAARVLQLLEQPEQLERLRSCGIRS